MALRIDQTLTQDATGTLVMLEFEAMGLPRVKTEISVQYVDHNLLQTDAKNAEDHLFLYSACQKYGLWYSRPGNDDAGGGGGLKAARAGSHRRRRTHCRALDVRGTRL